MTLAPQRHPPASTGSARPPPSPSPTCASPPRSRQSAAAATRLLDPRAARGEPAQGRDLNAIVVEEFVDAGESARKADRPELMRMIEYVKTHQVAYCIVHKVDRLARNRADDVAIHLALKDAGVMLVSATENIDETPSGMLLHGIMSTIAEFYSRNLANEVAKGMTRKPRRRHRRQGTHRLPQRPQARRARPRVPHRRSRPRACTAGRVGVRGVRDRELLDQLHEELIDRGLTTVPTPKRPAAGAVRSSERTRTTRAT
jgi:hypothetical protein